MGVCAEARNIVQGLLQTDPEQRISLQDVKRQPWLLGDSCSGNPKTVNADEGRAVRISTESLFGSSVSVAPSKEKNADVVNGTRTECVPSPIRAVSPQGKRARISTAPLRQSKLTVALAAGAAPPGYERPLLPPMQSPQDHPRVSIQTLDDSGRGHVVEGTVRFRSDHKSGGGFHLRINDSTGEIDIKFWDEAAKKYKTDSSLRKEAVIRFSGFKLVPLKPKDMLFAPPGRRHSLNYSSAQDVQYNVLVSAAEG